MDASARPPNVDTAYDYDRPIEDVATWLADMAVGALIDEATLTPKPGLVDLRGRGAHSDLNWDLLCHSAWALHGSFRAMAAAGQSLAAPHALREAIGRIGREAEHAMMVATGGINTHRGAIWALGLLVTAAALDMMSLAPASVTARAGALARIPDHFAPAETGNKGERACKEYGVGGARAQAQADFPHITGIAMPFLLLSRTCGASEDAARINALLAVMANLDDTCVLSRGGLQALESMQSGARQVLYAGGAESQCGRLQLQLLEDELLERKVSPGGAADLLAATLFLDRLSRVQTR